MDCDEALWKLTSDPRDQVDEEELELLMHLAICTSCEQIAEALRPAPSLRHEALPVSEQVALPVFRSTRVKAAAQFTETRYAAPYQSRSHSSDESSSYTFIEYELEREIDEEAMRGEAWAGVTRVALFVSALAVGGMTLGWWVC